MSNVDPRAVRCYFNFCRAELSVDIFDSLIEIFFPFESGDCVTSFCFNSNGKKVFIDENF